MLLIRDSHGYVTISAPNLSLLFWNLRCTSNPLVVCDNFTIEFDISGVYPGLRTKGPIYRAVLEWTRVDATDIAILSFELGSLHSAVGGSDATGEQQRKEQAPSSN